MALVKQINLYLHNMDGIRFGAAVALIKRIKSVK